MPVETTPKSSKVSNGVFDPVWLGLLCLAFFIPALFRPFWNPDETRYSLIPLLMLKSGDWTVPRLNWVAYFEKPIFSYWLTALSFKVFGFSRFAARFWLVIAGSGGAVLTYWCGRRMFGRLVAWVGSLMLVSCILYAALSTTLTTDIIFSFFLYLVWTCFWFIFNWDSQQGTAKLWMYKMGFWVGCSCAFLTKGPLGLILPFISIVPFCFIRKNWKKVFSPGLITGAVVFVLINLPWHVGVFKADPRFLEFFYIRENFQAFFEGEIHHPGSRFYYLLTYFGGFFPWSFLGAAALVGGAWKLLKSKMQALSAAHVYLFCIAVPVFCFFTVASVKLHTYLLPAFPAFALLTAEYFVRTVHDNPNAKVLRFSFLAQACIFTIALIVAASIELGGSDDYRSAEEALFKSGAGLLGLSMLLVLIGGMFFSAVAAVRRFHYVAFAAMVLTFGLSTGLLQNFLGFEVHTKTSEHIIDKLPAGIIKPQDLVVCSDETDYSVPLGLERRVAVIGRAGELGFGYYIEGHPEGSMPSIDPYDVSFLNLESDFLLSYDDLKQMWNGDRRIWFFVKHNHLKRFDPQDLPLYKMGQNGRTVLVTNKKVSEDI